MMEMRADMLKAFLKINDHFRRTLLYNYLQFMQLIFLQYQLILVNQKV